MPVPSFAFSYFLYCGCELVGSLEGVEPCVLTKLLSELLLDLAPIGERSIENAFSPFRQRKTPGSAVRTLSTVYPPRLHQQAQTARQRRAVDRENVAQLALSHRRGELQGLQDRELSDRHAVLSQNVVIRRRHRAGGSTDGGTQAREFD